MGISSMGQNNRIEHIDAWRTIAVVLVILFHIVEFSNLAPLANEVPGIVWRLNQVGPFGVMIFFCISGFVICRGLVQEQRSSASVSLGNFYLKRALRILPPLMLYVGALAALSSLGVIEVTAMEMVRSLTFTCNVWECGWYTGHTWSVAYEEQFYLLFPLLFILLALTTRPKILLLVIACLMAGALLAETTEHPPIARYLMMFIYMLAGCACALYWATLRPALQRMPPVLWLLAAAALFMLAGLAPVPDEWMPWLRIVVFPPLICLVVLGTPVSNPIVRAIFENRVLTYVGKISYTIYLWQQLATASFPTLAPWWSAVFVALVFVFAHYSYQYFERPLMRVAARWAASIKDKSLANQDKMLTYR